MFRRIRVAHAIEHAAVAVLHQRVGRRAPTIALSDPFGFSVVSPYSAEDLESAVAEALSRLRSGEHALAVSDLCGTNLAVGGLLAATAALAAANGRARRNFPSAVAAAALALVAAPAAGRWVQRALTVEPNIGNARVAAVQKLGAVAGLPVVRVWLALAP
ncbi:hypothetical protein HRbin29_00211 [bacterium HR29]|nr:hypothetical protein HRbin29_00211 [bacterium HR29]